MAGPGSGTRRATDAHAFDALAVVEPEEGLGRRPEGPRLLDDALDGGKPERDAGGQGGGGILADRVATGLEAPLGEGPPVEAAHGPRTTAAAGQRLEGLTGQAQNVHAAVGLRHEATVVESRPRINSSLGENRGVIIVLEAS